MSWYPSSPSSFKHVPFWIHLDNTCGPAAFCSSVRNRGKGRMGIFYQSRCFVKNFICLSNSRGPPMIAAWASRVLLSFTRFPVRNWRSRWTRSWRTASSSVGSVSNPQILISNHLTSSGGEVSRKTINSYMVCLRIWNDTATGSPRDDAYTISSPNFVGK